MSIEQRTLVSDLTKWIMRIAITVAGFLLVQTYYEVRTDTSEIKTSLHELEKKMIRIEYELKLNN